MCCWSEGLCESLTLARGGHVPSLDRARRVTHPQSLPTCPALSALWLPVPPPALTVGPKFGDAKSSLLARKGQWLRHTTPAFQACSLTR